MNSGRCTFAGQPKRIVIYSPAFLPHVGGLELLVAMLAEGLAQAGHRVWVVTTTPGQAVADAAYETVRQPGPLALMRLVRRADVFFQANVSLKGIWPWFLSRASLVLQHNGDYAGLDALGWRGRLKMLLTRMASKNIAVSHAVARAIPAPCDVIWNCYDDSTFKQYPDDRSTNDLIFVGRLVSEKGADIAVRAVAMLRARGLNITLAVAGDGPERSALADLAAELGIDDAVRFLGVVRGTVLCREMNKHAVMVVPSRYKEPFGIVALEGIASGCVVVGTADGGLPEAIGPCGLSVPRESPEALADAIAGLVLEQGQLYRYRQKADVHLHAFTRAQVVSSYLQVVDDLFFRDS